MDSKQQPQPSQTLLFSTHLIESENVNIWACNINFFQNETDFVPSVDQHKPLGTSCRIPCKTVNYLFRLNVRKRNSGSSENS